MTRIYNKEIISELEVDLFCRDYRIIVLDNSEQDTYDIHIITDRYKKDELYGYKNKGYTFSIEVTDACKL